MDLRLSTGTLGSYVVITAGGELHAATAPALRSYVTSLAGQQPGRDVILDLAGVSFADAAGVSALVAARSAIRDSGGSLRLARLSRQLRVIFAAARLTSHLVSYPIAYTASVSQHGGHGG